MKNSKGVELPMNTLVVVTIAVIILLAMTAFFIGGFGPISKDIQLKQDFQKWCNRWVQENCDPDSSIADEVFNAYNKWQQRYRDSMGNLVTKSNIDSATECQGVDDCWNKKVIPTLQSACGCWFIAPTSPETGTQPQTGTEQGQQGAQKEK